MTSDSWLLSMKLKTRIAISVAVVLAQLAAGIFWAFKSQWASATALLFAVVLQSGFYWGIYRSERARLVAETVRTEREDGRG